MPKYRIISEIDPMAEHRISRGAHAAVKTGAPAQRLVTIVGAMDITDAALNLHREMPDYEDHEDRRVISIEEIHPGFTVTDEQITNALTSPEGEWTNEPMVDPEEFSEGQSVYGSGDFIWTVDAVAEALRESGLVPGLHVSLLQNNSGFVDYSMIEIHDDTRMIYLSRGAELKHLTEDRSATGWNGVLAIARALIALSNDLH